MAYSVKTPWWLSRILYPKLVWKMPVTEEQAVYLTFDDGPHQKATRFVLNTLAKYDARATFFCIGKNVLAHPQLYAELIANGHTIGNHTQNHMNGWKSKTSDYLANIHMAAGYIDSRLFRPPYGRIKRKQANQLLNSDPAWKIYMWDILSGDFDTDISPQQCLDNVLKHIAPGSIITFHDSAKAWERMSYALPHVLAYCKQKNWVLKALPKE